MQVFLWSKHNKHRKIEQKAGSFFHSCVFEAENQYIPNNFAKCQPISITWNLAMQSFYAIIPVTADRITYNLIFKYRGVASLKAWS